MWIRRIAVESWRGLSFSLDGLAPGLNLIAGPNESGKSRLVEALRFALFESTSGKASHKKNLESWGVGSEKPRVTVEFESDETVWHLEKVFLGTGYNTRLSNGSADLSGEEAERHLADLLGVAGRGSSKAVKLHDQGIWSLLWVEQGESQLAPAHNADAQDQILGILTEEIGEVAAGESGMRLLQLAETERGRYYTPKAVAPKDTLIKPRAAVQDLEARLADARRRRDEQAQAADDLEATRGRITELEARQREADGRLEELRRRHEQTESLRHELSVAEERVSGARQSREEIQRQLDSLEREHRDLAALAEAIQASEQALAGVRLDEAAARSAFEGAHADYQAVQAQIETLDGRLRTLRRQEKLTSQRAELQRIVDRLDEARQLVERETALRAELAKLPTVRTEDVTRLRKALDVQTTARAKLQGASVSLSLTATRDLEVDGVPLAAGDTRRFTIDDDQAIDIGDVASIQVRPGAGEILALREDARESERQVIHILDSLGVADAEQAEGIARQREALAQDLKHQQETIAQRLPEGLPALEQAEAALRTIVETTEAESSEREAFDPDALQSTEEALKKQSNAATEAHARRAASQDQLSKAQIARAKVESRLESERKQHESLGRRVSEQPSQDDVREKLTAAQRGFNERVAARDALKERFEASGGDALAQDLERAEKAESQLRDQLATQHEHRVRLETVLASSSGEARHELVLELEAELTLARDALSRVERQAAAARRLHDVLDREYRAARDRLVQPVLQRIRPYLDALFPGSEVWLDEELALKGLRTKAGNEHFEFLSGGAREQLSLLVRIGLAEVVGSEESWPLVLDDVLVNTDAERIQRMQRALFGAGRKMQILLFTCHGALFDALGPDTYIELPAPPARASARTGGEAGIAN